MKYLFQFIHSCQLNIYYYLSFWITDVAEVNLWRFESGKAEITTQIEYESLTQRLPKLRAEKAIQIWFD